MGDRHSLRIAIVPRPVDGSFAGIDYWLRMEQVFEGDIVSTEDVAEIVDELYGIDTCSPEPTAEEEPPPITWERIMEIAARRLDIEECMRRASGDYQARVKVVYSHPDDEDNRPEYSVTIGKVVSVARVHEDVTLTLSVREQTSAVLDVPVPQPPLTEWPGKAKWLGSVYNEELGAIKPPSISGSGSVIAWGVKATGTIIVKVPTVYEIVTVEVPGVPRFGSLAGDSQDTLLRAFYRLQVYELDITAISHDQTADQQTLAKLCGWDSYHGGEGDTSDQETGAGQDISGDDDGDDRDDGPELGCLEPAGNLADPEFYRAACCQPPPFGLPDCAEYATPLGQKQPSQEAKAREEANSRGRVSYVAVGPGPDGCGRLIKRQQVVRRNCCADVTPMSPHPDNPTSMGANDAALFRVLNGRQWVDVSDLWDWEASDGLHFSGGATRAKGGREMMVYSPSEWCDGGQVRVDDGCTVLNMHVDNRNPPQELSIYDDGTGHTVAPEGYVTLLALGGVPPYTWTDTAELTLITSEHANPATFQASSSFCGTATIRVSDACTEQADAVVRSTDGVWEEVFDFDPCSPPGKGGYQASSTAQGSYSVSGEHQIYVLRTSDGFFAGDACSSSEISNSIARGCGVNNQITTTFNEWASMVCHWYDYQNYCGIGPDYSQGCCLVDGRGTNQCDMSPLYQHITSTEFVSRLWEWVCP